jgi:L-methionine (R)-S-oxide reductase
VYRLEGEELVLAAWDGEQPTEHTRIPVATGICGRAVRESKTIVVDDVRTSTDYLACFLETRAEIVVPVRADGTILGEIDIDGNEVKAFDASDARFLEMVAARIAPSLRAAAGGPAAA